METTTTTPEDGKPVEKQSGDKEVSITPEVEGDQMKAEETVPDPAHKNSESCLSVPAKKEFSCDQCGKKFHNRWNVSRHEKNAHSVGSKEVKEKQYVCNVCKKAFLTRRTLSRHRQQIHKIARTPARQTAANREQNYECHVCAKQVTNNGNLRRHLASVHKIMCDKKINMKCSECLNSFVSRNSFLDHVRDIHRIPVNVEELHFDTLEEFESWKSATEKSSLSKFVKFRSSYNLSTGNTVVIHVCHRNGSYKSTATGKRRIKLVGTNKIEYFCPASIFVTSDTPENLFPASIRYCPLHLGHECEVERLPVPMKESEDLAGQLDKDTKKLIALRKLHQLACERLHDTNIFEGEAPNTWIVPSFTNFGKTHEVRPSKMSNHPQNCNLICVDCNVCLHRYKCNCTVKHIFCEHIHFVCQKLKTSITYEQLNEDVSERVFYIDVQEEEIRSGKNVTLKELQKTNSRNYQNDARNAVLEFLAKLERYTKKEQCLEIIKTMSELSLKCEAMDNINKSRMKANKKNCTKTTVSIKK